MCAPEAIKFRLDQLDKTGKVREALLGGRGQVSEILTKKRSLSLEMIRCRLRELQIPLESLVSSAAERRLFTPADEALFDCKPRDRTALTDVQPSIQSIVMSAPRS